MDKKPLLLIGAFVAVVVVAVLIALAIEASSHSDDPTGMSSALLTIGDWPRAPAAALASGT
jgi:hypothetical protein